jgi:hypothetical protein
MKRAVAVLSALMIVLSTPRPAYASTPYIQLRTSGIELCPQFICPSGAIFTGIVFGRVGFNPWAFGTFTVQVRHAELPLPGDPDASILGGAFEIKVGLRRITGLVTGGTLHNNSNNTFTVHAELLIQDGGSGELVYDGLLDHNVFPPTVVGNITQPY